MQLIRRMMMGSAIVGLSLATSPALAQAPRLTTATYDDWTVRCEMAGAVKTCEIEQTSQVQGQPFSQVALARRNTKERT